MTKINYKDFQGNTKTIQVENGLSVMEGAIQNEIPGIDADCGGSMACATCHVYVNDKWINKIPKAEASAVCLIASLRFNKYNCFNYQSFGRSNLPTFTIISADKLICIFKVGDFHVFSIPGQFFPSIITISVLTIYID